MLELVKRAKQGDAKAFVSLMDANKEMLKRVAFMYLKNEEDVADALQETILNSFQNLSSLRKAEYFKTWLVRILINICLNMYNERKKEIDLRTCYRAEDVNDLKDGDYEQIEFLDLLEILPENSKIIFQLYYGEGFTVSQIAEILKENRNTVKSRLQRGKEILRENLK